MYIFLLTFIIYLPNINLDFIKQILFVIYFSDHSLAWAVVNGNNHFEQLILNQYFKSAVSIVYKYCIAFYSWLHFREIFLSEWSYSKYPTNTGFLSPPIFFGWKNLPPIAINNRGTCSGWLRNRGAWGRINRICVLNVFGNFRE